MGENGRVEIHKPSEKLLKVEVFVHDPRVDENGETSFRAFVGRYKWVRRFQTLIAHNCFHATPPENPHVVDKCQLAVRTASEVVRVMTAASIHDRDKDGLNDVATCIKKRLSKPLNLNILNACLKLLMKELKMQNKLSLTECNTFWTKMMDGNVILKLSNAQNLEVQNQLLQKKQKFLKKEKLTLILKQFLFQKMKQLE